MEAIVLQEDIVRALSSVSRFVSPRAQLPVLANILIATDKNKLRLAATNLEMGISYQIGAKIEKEGAITIPAKIIGELVSNLSAGKITLKEEKGQLKIIANSSSTSLSGIPANEFPEVPRNAPRIDFSLNKEILDTLNKQVVFAASRDESRPILNGVFFIIKDKGIRVVATDGFRLSCKDVDGLKKGREEQKVLIPGRLIEEVVKLAGNGDEEIGVSILDNEKQLIFTTQAATLTGRIIEGTFPDYERIIPKENTITVQMSREDLTRAVKTASVIAREASGVVRLKLKKDSVLVIAESSSFGREEATLDAKIEGGEVEIAFNYKYLLDFLNSTPNSEILFLTNGPTSQGVFKDMKDESYLHLIMPIRV